MTETAADLAIPFRSVAETLARHAAANPCKTAIVDLDSGKTIDFAGLRDAVERIAARLEAMGVVRGDRVVVLADERMEKLLVFLAVWRIGAVACPFHAEMSIPHLRAIIAWIGPRLVLWHTDLDGEEIAGGLGYPSARFSSWPDGDSRPGEFFASLMPLDRAAGPCGANAASDTACIFSTSGRPIAPNAWSGTISVFGCAVSPASTSPA